MKLWIFVLSLAAVSAPASAKCVFTKTSPVLKIFEIRADSNYQLAFPIRAADGGGAWTLAWDPQTSELSFSLTESKPQAMRFRVSMPEFLEQPGAREKWKSLLQDLEGANSLAEAPPADTDQAKVIGVLRYPTKDKTEVLELVAYQLKKLKGASMQAEGADELGRWLSIRCGPPVSQKK